MANTTGSSWHARSFAATEPAAELNARRLAFLMGLGVGIVLLHEVFKWHLKLPGHHGLEAMALMMFGRLSSGNRWAATLVGAAAATSAAAVSYGSGPLQPAFYLLPGLAMDVAWRFLPGWRSLLFVVPFLGGLAWASRPLARWLIAENSGLAFQSVVTGLAWPAFTHFVFGTIGAALATVGWYRLQKKARAR